MARLTGHGGAIYFGVVPLKIAEAYNWVFEDTVKVERCSVKGDGWERKLAGRGDGTVTCEAYVTTFAFLSRLLPTNVGSSAQITFRLDAIDANAGFQQVSGTGYITRGRLTVPHDALITDVIEITLDGAPVVT